MRVRIELIAYSRVRKKYAIKNAGMIVATWP